MPLPPRTDPPSWPPPSTSPEDRRTFHSIKLESQIEFEFLNVSHPSEARSSATRRKVRSHVTRHQHYKEQQAMANSRAGSPNAYVSRRGRRPSPPKSSSSPSPSAQNTPNSSPLPTALPTPDASLTPATAAPASIRPVSPHSAPHCYAAGHYIPLTPYPQEWHFSIPSVLSHYLSNMAAAQLPFRNDPVALQARWFPLLVSTPLTLHPLLLLSASHLQALHGTKTHGLDLTALRGMAISAVNSALLTTTFADSEPSLSRSNSAASSSGTLSQPPSGNTSPTRSTLSRSNSNSADSPDSDAIVAAVTLLAHYEALQNDRVTYATHMAGLQKLIELRGGLAELGLGGTLERVVRWVDANGGLRMGRGRVFAAEEEKRGFGDGGAGAEEKPRVVAGTEVEFAGWGNVRIPGR
ncbi:DNA-directed RNA polymerase III subunit rpc1 [Sphaceloma murrayae]|uniref:DNA-directed RNA polymerase III subunit rpc1 n=1 Tax=Sphaceloma murrayae TaxID=2082308 RepID=A0A2K1QUN0_9PEZI|nr:DNA-directed RNA polymerase III subunit rpc1 [Sphaceloma murrayae]